MPKLSVPEAAERLGVSAIRVRQRIEEGSLIAEKVGNRWLVDLSVIPKQQRRGRPVHPALVWDAIRRADLAAVLHHEEGRRMEEALRCAYGDEARGQVVDRGPDLVLPDGSIVDLKSSASSQRRALLRLVDVANSVEKRDDDSPIVALLGWLSNRAERRLYRVSGPDFDGLRDDERVLHSGLSHPRSGMQDPRILEGYVAVGDLGGLVDDHWLDPPGVDAAPNVFLHVAPGRPDGVSPLMLAADLAEHDGAREHARANQLVVESFS